jgi:phage baseplate assembly protein V
MPDIRRFVSLGTELAQSGGLMRLQASLLADEIQDGVEYLQPFGFLGNPLPGAEGVTLANMGQSAQRVALCVGDRLLEPFTIPGESFQYNAFGCRILLKADGSINIVAPAGLTITTSGSNGTVTINGNLMVTGQVQDTNGTMQEIRNIYNIHTDGDGPPTPQMT